MLLRRTTITSLCLGILCAATIRAQDTTFEGQPAILFANDKLQLTVMKMGSAIGSVVLGDDAQRLNPLWNPARIARELGRQPQVNGTLGHFICVDGFGQPSGDERAAGLPQHGEAHITQFTAKSSREGTTRILETTAQLPIVQEAFTRTFRIVDGENVVYVDSQLENLMGFDRPVNWAEHATIAAPFLESGVSRLYLSGTRSQNRDYTVTQNQNQKQAPGRGGQPGNQRRLAPGKDFTWPMAPGLDGQTVDMSDMPANPHYTDHVATLMDLSKKLAWVASINPAKHLVYGYIFKTDEYPWIQHWGNYPSAAQAVRGMEFGTQPYDFSRRQAIDQRSMFDTATYRWLPAKSKIESHFLLFYAHVPEGLKQIDDVRWENGRIVIEDRGAKQQMTLAASRGL
jgi:hypothetical protein